ncbi:ogr/Delta-like zinc finger family protein [Diaphorobacter nitroreducens]|uniref:ogr/Delta-like zinc finger family protein n=1 Tax=Diaphorobacter nitroreducens TaxID=164759 RepID=UPI0028A87D73|nr:ogr/Delta-like zinc finger family protein [Diaphorobacter nitroreducens]
MHKKPLPQQHRKPLPKSVAVRCFCPHCKASAFIRWSHEITPLVRRVSYACSNKACGHRFVAHAEATRTLSPSAKPDPSIYLPIAEATRNAIAQHPSMFEDESGPAVRLLASPAKAPEDRHAGLR